MSEPLFDVVIYEIATRKINQIAGEKMRMDEGFYNAEKRRETASERLNIGYDAAIVESGKYKKGDTLA